MFTYSCNIAHYQVIAQLYGQHVLGSPLALPVATSSLPGLLQLGLVPHDNGDCKSAESNLLVGSECVAKWMEDKVWYRARVDKVEGKFLEVTFLDYGNKESVAKCDVVKTAMDIPIGEDIDEFVIDVESGAPEVDTKQCVGLDIGDVIIAKWAEDNVWYNGEITKFNEDEGNTVEVCFTDYGDTADVEMVNIVKTIKEIPTQDEVDENVLVTEESSKDALVRDASGIEDLIMTIKTEVDETVGTIRPGVKCWVPEVGSIVVAKWLEDEVWYNAKVEKITDEGYTVVFIDYGNSTIVKSEHILKSALDIPEVDCIDECVDITLGDTNSSGLNTSNRWSEGCVCIAQWSEDNVWYNAVVKSDLGNGLYEVSFTDYGNNATVAGDKIVITASNIPPDQIEMIDECVNNNQIIEKELEEHEQKPSVIVDNDSLKPNATGDYDNATTGIPIQTTTADTNAPVDKESVHSTTSSAIPSACSKCYACWSEDNVWYNALIEKEEAPGVYFVTSTDYGNQETGAADRIVFKVDDIPVDQRDMVDENVEFETSEISEEQVVQGNDSAGVIAPEKPRPPLSCMQSGKPEAAVEGGTSKVREVMKNIESVSISTTQGSSSQGSSSLPAFDLEYDAELVNNLALCLVCANIACQASCSSTDLTLCQGCQSVAFCGEDCVHRGWNTHKHVCKHMKKVSLAQKKKMIRIMLTVFVGDVNDNIVEVDSVESPDKTSPKQNLSTQGLPSPFNNEPNYHDSLPDSEPSSSRGGRSIIVDNQVSGKPSSPPDHIESAAFTFDDGDLPDIPYTQSQNMSLKEPFIRFQTTIRGKGRPILTRQADRKKFKPNSVFAELHDKLPMKKTTEEKTRKERKTRSDKGKKRGRRQGKEKDMLESSDEENLPNDSSGAEAIHLRKPRAPKNEKNFEETI